MHDKNERKEQAKLLNVQNSKWAKEIRRKSNTEGKLRRRIPSLMATTGN